MKRFKLKKLNNEGAALIMAMVIVLFITILTSLLLYVSGVNYEMKTTDYRTKVSFYGAETPLEELKAQLAVDTSQATKVAYKHIMQNFSSLTPDVRDSEFQKVFFEQIEKIWQGRGVNDMYNADEWVTALQTVLSSDYDIYPSDETQDSSKQYHVEVLVHDPANGVQGTTLERDDVNGRIILLRIKVYYTENNYLSVIATDYAMNVPDIDWSVEANDNSVAGVSVDDATGKLFNFERYVSYLDWEKQ